MASSSARGGARVATLRDLGDDQGDSSEEDKDKQNMYAGGEKSGMLVQNPDKDRKGTPDQSIVNDILRKAAEGGRSGVADDDTLPTTSAPRIPSFRGAGYRLGSDDEPSAVVGSSAGQDDDEDDLDDLQKVTRDLTFWRDGFSIDDGPLLRYDDPANREFLAAINSGRAPLSLLNVRHGQPVDVRVARRLDEDYRPPPKKPAKPFSGTGNRLGSAVPAAVSSSSQSIPGAFPSSSSEAPAASAGVTPDESKPVTTLQLRLGDGSRLVAKFNHDHTVGDVRRHITAVRPVVAGRTFALQTPFPVKQLSDDNQTLKEAGVLNAVIVQRYT